MANGERSRADNYEAGMSDAESLDAPSLAHECRGDPTVIFEARGSSSSKSETRDDLD
jgi:hypothetical protein